MRALALNSVVVWRFAIAGSKAAYSDFMPKGSSLLLLKKYANNFADGHRGVNLPSQKKAENNFEITAKWTIDFYWHNFSNDVKVSAKIECKESKL